MIELRSAMLGMRIGAYNMQGASAVGLRESLAAGFRNADLIEHPEPQKAQPVKVCGNDGQWVEL